MATMQTVLADWLVANGLAEKERGYGHASGEDIAEKLLAAFDVRFKEPDLPDHLRWVVEAAAEAAEWAAQNGSNLQEDDS